MKRPAHLGVALVLGAASALIVPAADAPAAQVLVRNDLGTPAADNSIALGINASGVIVGQRYPGGSWDQRAFRWTPATGMVDLGTLGGATSSAASINDAGEILGTSKTASGALHGFVWDTTHGMVDLGTLGSGTTVSPAAISADGTVVGAAEVSATVTHAFRWTRSGGMQDLGTLGGANSSAAAVNNSGTVVGRSDTATPGVFHGFVWTATQGLVDVGTLGGALSSAEAIDAGGRIAGIASPPTGGTHAFRKDPGGPMLDLGSPGTSVTGVSRIGPAGEVFGIGYNGSEWALGFVATPATGVATMETGGLGSVIGGISPNGRYIPGNDYSSGFLVELGRGLHVLNGSGGVATVHAANDSGVAVGYVSSGNRFQAARWVRQTDAVASIGTASVVEGDGSANRTVKFAVTLSAPSTQPIKLPWYLFDSKAGNAASSSGSARDYVRASGKVTFTVGSTGLTATTKFVTATIKGDAAVEGPEAFVVQLGNPIVGTAQIGVEFQTARILENDPNSGSPTASIGDASVWEGDTGTARTVQVPITLNAAAGVPTSVRVTASNGTASSPGDYTAFSKVVKLSATATQAYVTVKLTADAFAEPDRTINVTLSSPTGGLALGRSAGTVTILDDD